MKPLDDFMCSNFKAKVKIAEKVENIRIALSRIAGGASSNGYPTSGTFFRCTNLTTVTFLNEYTNTLAIQYGAFAYCSKLTKVTLPALLVSIGGAVFRDCPLSEVHIAPPTLGTAVFTEKSPSVNYV